MEAVIADERMARQREIALERGGVEQRRAQTASNERTIAALYGGALRIDPMALAVECIRRDSDGRARVRRVECAPVDGNARDVELGQRGQNAAPVAFAAAQRSHGNSLASRAQQRQQRPMRSDLNEVRNAALLGSDD